MKEFNLLKVKDINTKKKENSTGKTMPMIWWSIPRYNKTETQERCSNQFWCG